MARMRVVIAGGGLAAIETMLGLEALAPDRVEVELIAPAAQFVYRPHLVAEPFSLAVATRVDLAGLAARHGARLRRDTLAAVDPGQCYVQTGDGVRLDYDALVIAIGARAIPAIEGALTFDDRAASDGSFRAVLDQLEAQGHGRLVFAVPSQVLWSLPAYELALLSAAHLRARGVEGVEIAVATREPRPLELLGEDAPGIIEALLDEAGVGLVVGAAPLRFEDQQLVLDGGGQTAADHVVALPTLAVGPIPGIPQRYGTGFVAVDGRLEVNGLEDVWAVGDVTSFPIKQGGLAAQQADVTAEAIASRSGSKVTVSTYRPVLRAALITGALPRFFRSALFTGYEAAASPSALWSPPAKLAGRHLGPFLAAAAHHASPDGEFIDLDPLSPAERIDEREHRRYELDFALGAADADARKGDYRGALGWLEVVEELTMILPPAYLARREEWQRLGYPDADSAVA